MQDSGQRTPSPLARAIDKVFEAVERGDATVAEGAARIRYLAEIHRASR